LVVIEIDAVLLLKQGKADLYTICHRSDKFLPNKKEESDKL